ncbi:MAG: hypothetical protein KFH87_08040 [Bacteroidetes bacterium]|nr:hypothetical protein [Bacteroidota bacterium]
MDQDRRPGPVIIILLILLSIGALSCSESIVSECDTSTAVLPMRASFAEIEQQVFAQSCATPGCHGGNRPQAGLDLSGTGAYDALVGVQSRTDPGRTLVSAGAPDESVLLRTLRRSSTPFMPPAGPLPSAVVDSIAVWVSSGALRN